MNFNTILEELDSLYEEANSEVQEKEPKSTAQAEDIPLTEIAEDEVDAEETVGDEEDEVEIEIEDDEDSDEVATTKYVMECPNCGAAVVKTADDATIDFETLTAEAECPFCGEASIYTVLGTVAPIEVPEVEEAEAVEETEEAAEVDVEDAEEIEEGCHSRKKK